MLTNAFTNDVYSEDAHRFLLRSCLYRGCNWYFFSFLPPPFLFPENKMENIQKNEKPRSTDKYNRKCKEIAADSPLLHNLYIHLGLCNMIWKSSCALSITLSSIIKILHSEFISQFCCRYRQNKPYTAVSYQAYILCKIWSTGSKKRDLSN